LKDSSLVKKVLKKQLEDLGPMTFHQAILATLFAVLILLWFFRDPGFVPGWTSLFPGQQVFECSL
jgi:di/tricarboxylate transporter